MIKKITINKDDKYDLEKCVCCIGFFDGVHIGHQTLINKTLEIANKKRIKPCLITFDPDPSDLISGKKNKHINSLKTRIKLFEKFGIKEVYVFHFDNELKKLSHKEFFDNYLIKMNIDTIVCGFDFRYANNGEGTVSALKKDCKGKINVYVVDEVKYYGKKVSSTRIIKEIEKGNYKLVNKLLGYEYK